MDTHAHRVVKNYAANAGAGEGLQILAGYPVEVAAFFFTQLVLCFFTAAGVGLWWHNREYRPVHGP